MCLYFILNSFSQYVWSLKSLSLIKSHKSDFIFVGDFVLLSEMKFSATTTNININLRS